MKVVILSEHGHTEAMLGLSLSYAQDPAKMPGVAYRLHAVEGENKFLESIGVWLDITAPRYWWVQMDTYRVGLTKQSASTMHTLKRRPLTQDDFERPIAAQTLTRLNQLVVVKDLSQLKLELPEGFLQRRVVTTNYKTLRHILAQRRNHPLAEWSLFCAAIMAQAEHKDSL